MDLLSGLSFLRDELAKIHICGWENIDRLSMCGRLLDNMISAVNSAQNEKGESKNAGTTATDKQPDSC